MDNKDSNLSETDRLTLGSTATSISVSSPGVVQEEQDTSKVDKREGSESREHYARVSTPTLSSSTGHRSVGEGSCSLGNEQGPSSAQDTLTASITEQRPYTPPSPTLTNPFRVGTSVSPASSIPNRNSEMASEDPFSIPATSATNNHDAPHLVSDSAHFGQTPTTALANMNLEDSSDYPPPPAYTPTTTNVNIASAPPVPTESTFTTATSGTWSPATSATASLVATEPRVTPAPAPSLVPALAPAPALSPVPAPAAAPTPPPRTPTSRESESTKVYVLKPIDWVDPATGIEKRIKIITQNQNGPCPLLALCNTLILQGKVEIRPYGRPSIEYDHLLELLANYLLHEDPTESNISSSSNGARVGERVKAEKTKSRLEIESALRLLPHLEHGLDVNVFFKSIRGFESTAELGLFHTFGVELVHGWVVSPVMDAPMYALADGPAGIDSYNKAVECIVSGDHAGGGLVVEDLSGNVNPISPSKRAVNNGSISVQDANLQNERISHALVVQEFMNTTRTQLTHYGLHVLQESLPEGHLCAFFRNNHFCTLFKNPMDGILYTLVTDQSLAHEQSIVWESLVDVDGAGDFLDGLFRHGTLEVGDYARNNQPLDSQHGSSGDGGGDEDFALALQLQQQEEEEETRRIQKEKNRKSGSIRGGSATGDIGSSSNGNNDSGGGAYYSMHNQSYETDEQMAARLHQEYLTSSQQQQQQQLQQRNVGRQYPQPGAYNQYPGYVSPQSQQPLVPYQGAPAQIQRQQAQQPGQVQGQNGHARRRNSSENSSRHDKDKCIIS